MGIEFEMSFQLIFVVYIIDAELNSVTYIPLKLVQQQKRKELILSH